MSLRGRLLIDRFKQNFGKYLALPCPPYGSPKYWENVYKTLGPEHVFEWANTSLEDVIKYKYRLDYCQNKISAVTATKDDSVNGTDKNNFLTATLAETILVDPEEKDDDDDDKTIMLLGCGNSKFGEDMANKGWTGPIIQVDVSSRVIETMSDRCSDWIEAGVMECIQDDATTLDNFQSNSVHAIVDKGLIDGLFCSDERKQISSVMESSHRVLKPGGVFLFFSFSEPRFLMQSIQSSNNSKMWRSIETRALDSLLLYRFQKENPKKRKLRHKRFRRRR